MQWLTSVNNGLHVEAHRDQLLGPGSGPSVQCKPIKIGNALRSADQSVASCVLLSYIGMKLRWLLFLALLGCAGAGSPSMFGEITSPNYPQVYPNNVVKTWNIQVPEGYGTWLYFTHLDIEPSEDCKNDSLQVIIGDEVQQTFCGRHLLGSAGFPREKFYPTSHIKLSFTSDFSNRRGYTGFAANYRAADLDECSSNAPCSHFCHNYIGGYLCSCPLEHELQEDQKSCGVISCPTDVFRHAIINPRKDKYVFKDMITVKCEEGYQMVSKQKKLPSFRAKCQGDGTWSSTHLECEPVDCGEPDKIVNGEVNFTDTTYGAKAVYYCKTEYYTLKGEDTYYCSVDGLWINSNKNSELPKCAAVCGKSLLTQERRIFGGMRAEDGFFPWLVRVVYPSQLGGGSLISDRWVLTAAQLLKKEELPILQVGAVDHTKATTIQAKKVFIHPDWVKDDGETTDYDNDIALIQLSRRIELYKCIYPICLPEKGQRDRPTIREVGYIAGWGQTQRKKIQKILQYTGVPLRDLEDCKKSLPNIITVTSNMLCAGEEGHDGCAGDSGGPLMFQDLKNQESKTFYIAGIISWGMECGQFGMYTKVQNYVDWIQKTIEEVEDQERDEEQQEPLNICKETQEGA